MRNVTHPLTRPSDTLSPTGGEGRGEGVHRDLKAISNDC